MDASAWHPSRDPCAGVSVRKTKIVTIDLPGRDRWKQFLITEMPASRAEKWAARAFLALAHAGVELPDEVRSAGMAALAVVGLRALAGVSFAEAEPLMDEMMECVQAHALPEAEGAPAKPLAMPRSLVENDIEEVATRALLKAEVFEVHTGFSMRDAISTSASRGTRTSADTSTSQPQSEPLSQVG